MALARSEAVQPSLWDRFVNDVPGLMAEVASLRSKLLELDPEFDLDRLFEEGEDGLRRRTDLDEQRYQLALGLVRKTEECAVVENRGILITQDVLREAVRRDIEMLFNVERLEAEYLMTEQETERVESPESMLADFPEVRRSVVNYGVPSFAGRKGSDFDADTLVRDLKKVLQVYETRLKSDSIDVKVSFGDKVGLRVDIDAILLLSPVPERLRLSTTIDMDSGRATTVQGEV